MPRFLPALLVALLAAPSFAQPTPKSPLKPEDALATMKAGDGLQVELFAHEPMLTSTDTWYRPSDVCTAPDGSMVVCGWYDPGVGGHGMGDTTRGRV